MSKRRVVLSSKEYKELVDARTWCGENGWDDMARWYDEHKDDE